MALEHDCREAKEFIWLVFPYYWKIGLLILMQMVATMYILQCTILSGVLISLMYILCRRKSGSKAVSSLNLILQTLPEISAKALWEVLSAVSKSARICSLLVEAINKLLDLCQSYIGKNVFS